MKKLCWVVGLLMLVALPASSHAIGLEFAVGGWYQDPSGDLSYKGLTANDTVSIQNDLMYDQEFRFTGRVKIDMPLVIPNVYLMATPMSFEGTGTKTVGFTFGDINFAQNVNYYSKVDLTHYDIGLYYGLPFLGLATLKTLNVDAGLNLRVVDFSAELRQDTLGLAQTKALTVPIPMLYAAVQITPIERFAIEGEARGIMIGKNKYYSLLARLKVKIIGPLFVAGGYRYDRIDIDQSDVRLDTTIAGFFLEAGGEF